MVGRAPGGPALVLATRNPHKVREVSRLLAPAGISVEALPDGVELPPEVGETFAENALPKARAAAVATGRPAIADDSGIEASALGGAPGVRSARYAGLDATDQENLEKLLREAPAGSPLRYVCVVAYVDPGPGPGPGPGSGSGSGPGSGSGSGSGPRSPSERVFLGECCGRLAASPRGSGGFGYDPAFVPDEDGRGRTMAELSDRQKDAISHRGRAVRELARWLTG